MTTRMGTKIHRKFRLPVLSRLTLAWVFFAAAGLLFSLYSATAGKKVESPARIAVALGSDIETLARPEQPAPKTASVLTESQRLEASASAAAPALREGTTGEEPFSIAAEDTLAYASTSGAPYAEDQLAIEPSDIVITIDGAPAQNAGRQVISPQAASLTRTAAAIPDPNPALLQKSPFGKIPAISSDGRAPARYYARPFESGKEPRVAIIVGGLGLNPSLTERAIEELPPEVTLAFAPYAKDLDMWTARAREAGHEIMLELPMEGHGGGNDALGPAALLTERTTAENLQRLDWLLSRFGGYFGVTNYLGGKFSTDREEMSAVLARLTDLGLVYIDDTGAARRALSDSDQMIVVNRMIGAGNDNSAAKRDLDALEKIAARDGEALGKTYAYDATIDAIGAWASDLQSRKIMLAPASSVLRTRGARG